MGPEIRWEITPQTGYTRVLSESNEGYLTTTTETVHQHRHRQRFIAYSGDEWLCTIELHNKVTNSRTEEEGFLSWLVGREPEDEVLFEPHIKFKAANQKLYDEIKKFLLENKMGNCTLTNKDDYGFKCYINDINTIKLLNQIQTLTDKFSKEMRKGLYNWFNHVNCVDLKYLDKVHPEYKEYKNDLQNQLQSFGIWSPSPAPIRKSESKKETNTANNIDDLRVSRRHSI